MREILNEPHSDCDWVFNGEGIATRKYDGTCVKIDNGQYFKRREVNNGKKAPSNFIEEQFDKNTGKRFGWVPIDPASKEDKWHIDDATKTPVDLKRWGGIVMLVSGPHSKKMLAQKINNLEEFGLSEPQMIITLGVRGLKNPLEILFGERTPSKDLFYVKLKHSNPVYLIDDTFCGVLMRLATEPPVPPLIKVRRQAQGKK